MGSGSTADPQPLRLVEVPRIGGLLVFPRRHQEAFGAEVVVLAADENLGVVLVADRLEPLRARIGVAGVSLVYRPRSRQSVIYDGDLVMQDISIGFVEIDALLEDRLVVLVKRQAGGIEFPRALEVARLDLQHIIAAVAILI